MRLRSTRVTVLLGLAATVSLAALPRASAQTPDAAATGFTVLHTFHGQDGSEPASPLTLSGDGRFYGATVFGGSQQSGNVFALTTGGKLTQIFDNPYVDPPTFALTPAAPGATSFYGIQLQNDNVPNYFGEVFLITAAGKYTDLHDFTAPDPNSHYRNAGGATPSGPVTVDKGVLYGAASAGGTHGDGVLYSLTPKGSFKVLHQFSGGADGNLPQGALTLGADGALYGTTSRGGRYDFGVVYRLTPAGGYRVVHAFDGSHGGNPTAGLTLGEDSTLYGVTARGGAGFGVGNEGPEYTGAGVIYRLTAGGAYSVTHEFQPDNQGNYPDGEGPSDPLALGQDGTFYGVTPDGGISDQFGVGRGVVFSVTPGGSLSVLYRFTGGKDGAGPNGPPAVGPDGALYGTTVGGGSTGDGVVYRLTLP